MYIYVHVCYFFRLTLVINKIKYSTILECVNLLDKNVFYFLLIRYLVYGWLILTFLLHSAKRTTIIDDQMDYYSADSGWLTSKQREQLKQKEEEQYEKKHGSRKTKKITIDFAGTVVFSWVWKIFAFILHTHTGRQVYEAEESENEIEPILDDEETFPTIINEHLNNPLIKLNIKVVYFYFFGFILLN